MEPTAFPEANRSYGAPRGWNEAERGPCESLPAFETEDGRVVSRWRPTWGERLRLLLGWPVWMQVSGAPPPPVALDVQRTPFIEARS